MYSVYRKLHPTLSQQSNTDQKKYNNCNISYKITKPTVSQARDSESGIGMLLKLSELPKRQMQTSAACCFIKTYFFSFTLAGEKRCSKNEVFLTINYLLNMDTMFY